jgi:hypothetical protein
MHVPLEPLPRTLHRGLRAPLAVGLVHESQDRRAITAGVLTSADGALAVPPSRTLLQQPQRRAPAGSPARGDRRFARGAGILSRVPPLDIP